MDNREEYEVNGEFDKNEDELYYFSFRWFALLVTLYSLTQIKL